MLLASLSPATASSTQAVATGTFTAWTTATFGGYTIPPVTDATQVITLGSSTWTTTYISYPGSPAPSPVALDRQVYTIIVGGAPLIFDSSHISTLLRDTVVFEFREKNHTVIQSSFADPYHDTCVTRFDSEFMLIAASAATLPTRNYTVTDQFRSISADKRHLKLESHCGQGMIFESSTRKFSASQNFAIALKSLNGTNSTSTLATPLSTSTWSCIYVHETRKPGCSCRLLFLLRFSVVIQ